MTAEAPRTQARRDRFGQLVTAEAPRTQARRGAVSWAAFTVASA